MERTRTRNPQAFVALLAVAFAIAAIWAATALAGGGSSSSASDPTGGQPVVEYVQTEDDTAPSADDCPDRDGGSSDGGSADSGSGSSSTDF